MVNGGPVEAFKVLEVVAELLPANNPPQRHLSLGPEVVELDKGLEIGGCQFPGVTFRGTLPAVEFGTELDNAVSRLV